MTENKKRIFEGWVEFQQSVRHSCRKDITTWRKKKGTEKRNRVSKHGPLQMTDFCSYLV